MITSLQHAENASEVLSLVDRGAVVIAGGTDFVALYAAGAIPQEVAVDVTRVPELTTLDSGPRGARIGAAVPLTAVATLDAPGWLAVADGAALVGSVQTRNRGTLGGNACRSSPSGDALPGLLVADALMVARSQAGVRHIAATDFFLGPGVNALSDGEYLESIELPTSRRVTAYHRATTRRAMDLATVGVALAVEVADGVVTEVRLAIGGAGPRPIFVPDVAGMFAGQKLDDAHSLLGDLDARAQDAIAPIDDVRGSAWYRRRLVRPLLDRAWHTLLDRHGEAAPVDREESR